MRVGPAAPGRATRAPRRTGLAAPTIKGMPAAKGTTPPRTAHIRVEVWHASPTANNVLPATMVRSNPSRRMTASAESPDATEATPWMATMTDRNPTGMPSPVSTVAKTVELTTPRGHGEHERQRRRPEPRVGMDVGEAPRRALPPRLLRRVVVNGFVDRGEEQQCRARQEAGRRRQDDRRHAPQDERRRAGRESDGVWRTAGRGRLPPSGGCAGRCRSAGRVGCGPRPAVAWC